MTSNGSPPKSYDREGGQRVELARYARWFGVFLLCLTVASWTALQQRPAIPDDDVAEAVAWAESAPRIPCERLDLSGEVTNGCTPERRDDAWIEQRAREIRDGGGIPMLFEALQEVDDRLRGPRPQRPLDTALLSSAGDAATRRGEGGDVERAHVLPDTAPTERDYLIASAAAFIEGPLERGRVVSRHHPHARAEVVALARIARRAEPCETYECVIDALHVTTYPLTPKWRSFLMGPRAAARDRITDTEMHWRNTYARELGRLHRHRLMERELADQFGIPR